MSLGVTLRLPCGNDGRVFRLLAALLAGCAPITLHALAGASPALCAIAMVTGRALPALFTRCRGCEVGRMFGVLHREMMAWAG